MSDAPAEPRDGTVVVDAAGFAWQRQGERWYLAGNHGMAWAELRAAYGPVVVVHEWSWDE